MNYKAQTLSFNTEPKKPPNKPKIAIPIRGKLINTLKKEVAFVNFSLRCDDPECIVRSQWQSQSKNYIYLAYRWCVAVFVVAIVIVSMVDEAKMDDALRNGTYFVYLTHWGVWLNMIVGVLGAVLVTIWHFHTDFYACVVEHREMPLSFKIHWSLHNIALVISFVITIVYWAAVYVGGPVYASNILSHVFNSAIMLLDIVIASHPLRLYHAIQPICFGICYGLFSFIYYQCGGLNSKGQHYIYKVLDWSKPGKAFGTFGLTLILAIFVHIALFALYKLRVYVQRRYFSHAYVITEIERQTTDDKLEPEMTILDLQYL